MYFSIGAADYWWDYVKQSEEEEKSKPANLGKA